MSLEVPEIGKEVSAQAASEPRIHLQHHGPASADLVIETTQPLETDRRKHCCKFLQVRATTHHRVDWGVATLDRDIGVEAVLDVQRAYDSPPFEQHVGGILDRSGNQLLRKVGRIPELLRQGFLLLSIDNDVEIRKSTRLNSSH